MTPFDLQRLLKKQDVSLFAREVLGLTVHAGQAFWFKNSNKPINILKPANQWGKTTSEAIMHIWHAVTKPALKRLNMSFDDKFHFNYKTLNFGKTYEVARGVMEHIQDLVQGRYLLPDGTLNKSLLKGWAIISVNDMPKLPQINWWNNSSTLIRSYDGLGESFKRLRLAFASGDECGDIPELNLFVNSTLLPRLFFFAGSLHLVGTSQPKGLEYEEMAELAEEDLKTRGLEKSRYFIISAHTNADMASVYRNDFMPKARIEEIERVADPELRKQIIYGQYVDWSKHLYTWDEVNQMFKTDIPYNLETGFSQTAEENGYYVFAVDLAATEDWTSSTCIRYNIRTLLPDGTFKPLPHQIVFHKAWKGSSLPLSLQYEMIKQFYYMFKNISPLRTKFVYDAGGLGGKNAGDAFSDLHGFPFPPTGRGYPEVKAEGMGKVKEVLGRGRDFVVNEHGMTVDKNADWGGIRASSAITELRRQIEVASRDDDKLRNDQYTSFMMALHYIESRAPRSVHTKAVDFNYSHATM